MCCATQSNVGMGMCMCVSSLNKSPVHSYFCVCVCVMKRSWECYKRSTPRCACLCASKIKGRHGCVCVCHHHSPVVSLLCVCVYVSICMLTPLNDCDYIRQYFTVNYKVLCIKMVLYSHISTSCNLLSSPHSCPPLILRVHEHTHIWCAHLQPF